MFETLSPPVQLQRVERIPKTSRPQSPDFPTVGCRCDHCVFCYLALYFNNSYETNISPYLGGLIVAVYPFTLNLSFKCNP